jgi:predicted kinase
MVQALTVAREHVLIITGAPATGKTTIGRRLAADLGLPLIGKDDIKEILFDTIGWKDRAWSRHLAVACYRLMYYVIEQQLAAGESIAVESNFDRERSTPAFVSLQSRYPFRAVQVLCHADGAVLMERFVARDRSGARHPGHIDRDAYHDVEAVLARGRIEPLALDGPIIEVDTTDPQAVDYDALLRQVRDAFRAG